MKAAATVESSGSAVKLYPEEYSCNMYRKHVDSVFLVMLALVNCDSQGTSVHVWSSKSLKAKKAFDSLGYHVNIILRERTLFAKNFLQNGHKNHVIIEKLLRNFTAIYISI